jgi:hypothetical protein
MNPDDIEGEEAGDSFVIADEEIKFTPFNMKVSKNIRKIQKYFAN